MITGKAKPSAQSLTEGSPKRTRQFTRSISRLCFLCHAQATAIAHLLVFLPEELRGCKVTLCLACLERLREWIGAERVTRREGRRG